ncbi:MAG: hypothetical protein ABSB23_01235 [Bryobacteraceae bacterium]|jgi:hypothetical protein
MALLDYQTALGRLVRAPDGTDPLRSLRLDEAERSSIEGLQANAGYRFTVGVQRSWCVGRAERAGYLTLSILPEDLRRRLLDDWTEAGGGTSSFFAAEAEAFLDFIAGRLPHPSHELTACRFEQATLRANQQAIGFTPPGPDRLQAPRCALRRGRHAGLVAFHGEPHAIIEALTQHQALPPVSAAATAILFAPGLEGLWRVASSREAALWEKLTMPVRFTSLARDGYRRDDIAAMLRIGFVEFVTPIGDRA